MVEVKNGKKILTTPISAEDLKDIKIGDMQDRSSVHWKMTNSKWYL